ncbi:MAG: FAD-dependent thymidylate synthase [Actinomycetota bacterium]
MKVELLEHTPDPERTIAAAARLCYAPIGADELFEKMSDKEVTKLIGFLIGAGHLSAVEHASFTFAIEGISRACTHQLVRHRLASYNQQSQRYVRFGNVDFIIPPAVRRDDTLREEFEKQMEICLTAYHRLLEAGIEPEDARYILPQSVETKIVMTMNARELLHFFTLRCCTRAQWEIRFLALKMLKMVKKTAPAVFANAGPACLRGPCPEGEMMCDRPWKKTG